MPIDWGARPTDRAREIADRYAEELFIDIDRLPVTYDGEYVTEGDFAAVIAQAIDEYTRRLAED